MVKDRDTQILHFLVECCDLGPHLGIRASHFYDLYLEWAREHAGEDEIMCETVFGRRMAELFQRKNRYTGRFYRGVRPKHMFVMRRIIQRDRPSQA